MHRRPIAPLLFNHLDAWVVAIAIAATALVVHDRLAWDTLPLLAVVGGAYWLAFALNDYFDAPADRLDQKKAAGNYFSQVEAGSGWVGIMALCMLGAVALALGYYGGTGVLVLSVGVLIAWAYSAPPLRLKHRPGIDVLTHALFVETYAYVVVLVLLGVAWSPLDGFVLAVLFLGSLSAQLEQQLRDYDLDRQTGQTFATLAGRPLTYLLLVISTLCLIGGAGIYFLRAEVPLYLVPYGLIPLPALLHRLWRGSDRPRSPRLVALTALIGLAYTIWLVATRFDAAAA